MTIIGVVTVCCSSKVVCYPVNTGQKKKGVEGVMQWGAVAFDVPCDVKLESYSGCGWKAHYSRKFLYEAIVLTLNNAYFEVIYCFQQVLLRTITFFHWVKLFIESWHIIYIYI